MIILLPYDSTWPRLFDQEKSRLAALLNDVVAIEHIGSTAIPGIYAKPVIDILIGVKNLNQFSLSHIKKIESLGYQYIQAYEDQLPHRRFFKKDDADGKRSHHIHLVNYLSAWWQRHLLFRDYLRKNPEQAKTYEAHKLHLAKKFNDTNQYAMAKTEFCQTVNKKAYFDFAIHNPVATTKRLNGYVPQEACFELYHKMFHDPDFVNCFGIELDDEKIKNIITRDTNYWDQYAYGPLVWFDKKTNNFVGEGGLNHTTVEGNKEIELTYSLSKNYWGKKLAVEIGTYAIHYGFNTITLNNIVCFTMSTNNRSLQVIKKLGFHYEKNFIHANLPHQLYRLKNPLESQ